MGRDIFVPAGGWGTRGGRCSINWEGLRRPGGWVGKNPPWAAHDPSGRRGRDCGLSSQASRPNGAAVLCRPREQPESHLPSCLSVICWTYSRSKFSIALSLALRKSSPAVTDPSNRSAGMTNSARPRTPRSAFQANTARRAAWCCTARERFPASGGDRAIRCRLREHFWQIRFVISSMKCLLRVPCPSGRSRRAGGDEFVVVDGKRGRSERSFALLDPPNGGWSRRWSYVRLAKRSGRSGR